MHGGFIEENWNRFLRRLASELGRFGSVGCFSFRHTEAVETTRHGLIVKNQSVTQFSPENNCAEKQLARECDETMTRGFIRALAVIIPSENKPRALIIAGLPKSSRVFTSLGALTLSILALFSASCVRAEWHNRSHHKLSLFRLIAACFVWWWVFYFSFSYCCCCCGWWHSLSPTSASTVYKRIWMWASNKTPKYPKL